MRRERQNQTASVKSGARGGERGRNFSRMMAVVVDQRVMPAFSGWNFSIALETAIHAGKARPRAENRLIRHFQLARNRDCGQRVAPVMRARPVQLDLKRSGGRAVLAQYPKAHPRAL